MGEINLRDKKGDADRFAATVEAGKLRGQYVDHSDRTTVADYARAWAATRPLLRSIYASAVLDRLATSSPVVRVQLPRDERVVPLTVQQVQALRV